MARTSKPSRPLKQLLAEGTYEGEASFEVKQGDEASNTTGKVKMYGGMLTAQITTEEFLGEKASAKAKGTLGAGKAMARGEVGAFRGYEHKTSGSLSIHLGDEPLVALTGGVGYSIGARWQGRGPVQLRQRQDHDGDQDVRRVRPGRELGLQDRTGHGRDHRGPLGGALELGGLALGRLLVVG